MLQAPVARLSSPTVPRASIYTASIQPTLIPKGISFYAAPQGENGTIGRASVARPPEPDKPASSSHQEMLEEHQSGPVDAREWPPPSAQPPQ